jgi:hypothetical protein
VCDAARVNALSREGRNALRALKTHVYLADGGGHGTRRTYPEAYPEGGLEAFVHPVGDDTP